MADRRSFTDIQRAFAAHIRDPEHVPAPEGIEDRRLAIYRELFFNNVSELMGRSFPVVERILGTDRWQALIRDWFVRHRAETPLFLELPRELLTYLQEEREPRPEDPPFLSELAHYEWVELALAIDEHEIPGEGLDPAGDMLEGRPVLSPLAWPLAYRFPVHRISPEFRPAEPPAEPTWLVVYRDRSDQVGFLEINRVTARLLELIGDANGARTGRSCLEQIAGELGHPRPDVVVEGGRATLEELRGRDVLLGTRTD